MEGMVRGFSYSTELELAVFCPTTRFMVMVRGCIKMKCEYLTKVPYVSYWLIDWCAHKLFT